jgi:hypothetical protein
MSQRCWECVRRRRVCDRSRPHCTKCTQRGIECPGYGKTKPITFLAPGQTLSKQWKPPKTVKQEHEVSSRVVTAPTSLSGSLSALSASWAERQDSPGSLSIASDLRTDLDDAVEAISYLNYGFRLLYADQYVVYAHFDIPPEYLRMLPTSVMHAVTVLAVSHRSLAAHDICTKPQRQQLTTRVKYHTWKAVSCLNDEVANDSSITVGPNMTAILWFLMIEVRSAHLDPQCVTTDQCLAHVEYIKSDMAAPLGSTTACIRPARRINIALRSISFAKTTVSHRCLVSFTLCIMVENCSLTWQQ